MANTQTHSLKSVDLEFRDLALTLQRYGGEQAQLVAKNPKMLKSTFDILIAIQKSDPLAGMSSVAGAVNNAAKVSNAGASVRSSTQAVSAVLSTFKTSMALVNVAKLAGPAAIGTYVGAIGLQKTGIAMSLAGGNNERAACIGAIMELAGSVTASAVMAPTGVLAWLAVASLAASTYNAHLACSGQWGR